MTDPTPDPTPDPDPAGAQNPDAYKQALDRMKAAQQAAEREAKAFKDLGLTPEQIRELQTKAARADPKPVDEDKIRADALKQAEDAATARFETQARRTAVREQARALGFHNAADALAEIDTDALAKVKVTDDEPDTDAIKALVEAVVKAKPYLVKPDGASARDAGIGGAGNTDRPEPRPGLDRIRSAYETSGTR